MMDFQFANSAAAGKDFERLTQQTEIGQNLDEDVDERAEAATDQDDVQPICVRAPADEVDDGDGHQRPGSTGTEMSRRAPCVLRNIAEAVGGGQWLVVSGLIAICGM